MTYGQFTFSAPVNRLLAPSLKDQKYLALLALPSDKQLPDGKSFQTLSADLLQKLDGPNPSANGFWKEASQGRTSFSFDVHGALISLPRTFDEYYHYPSFMTIVGVGAAFPVNWGGGETLQISGCNGAFSAPVTFPSGVQSIDNVRDTINAAITTAYSGFSEPNKPEEAPIVVSIDTEGPLCSGQLAIRSTRPSPAGDIAILGGTAVPTLGFSSPAVVPEKQRVDDRHGLFEDALVALTSGMTDEEVESLLNQYQSILVSVSGWCAYIWADYNVESFNIRGKSYTFGTIRVDYRYTWHEIAHEIGHDLGFPDLYPYKGVREIGEEPGPWCIMDNSYYSDEHPCAWIKAEKTFRTSSNEDGWCDPWLPTKEIGRVSAPGPHATSSNSFLLAPSSSIIPVTNPFSDFNVPLVRAIRLEIAGFTDGGEPTSLAQAIYVEAREEGPFSDPDLGTANYDTFDPANAVHGGVVVSDCVFDPGPVMRSNVVLLTPTFEPLLSAGQETKPIFLGAENKIVIRCKDIIRTNPAVYLMEIEWGVGTGVFDLRIEPWMPPPWESPDIWVDSNADNAFDEYVHSDPVKNPDVAGNPILNGDPLRPGWESLVYARVWNDGDRVAKNVVVDFRVVIPAGNGPGTLIGTDTIAEIPPGEFRLAKVSWTPVKPPDSHVCIRAIIHPQEGELNANNNEAQENITDWYLSAGSSYHPIEFDFQVHNHLRHRAPYRIGVTGLPRSVHVDVDPVQFWLEPNEKVRCKARIRADADAPLESKKNPASLISIEWRTPMTCVWRPTAGLSGLVHLVEKTDLSVSLRQRPGRELVISVRASTPQKPVNDANVAIKVTDAGGGAVLLERAMTDDQGSVQFDVSLPGGLPTNVQYQGEIILSPTIGTAPATVKQPLAFGT